MQDNKTFNNKQYREDLRLLVEKGYAEYDQWTVIHRAHLFNQLKTLMGFCSLLLAGEITFLLRYAQKGFFILKYSFTPSFASNFILCASILILIACFIIIIFYLSNAYKIAPAYHHDLSKHVRHARSDAEKQTNIFYEKQIEYLTRAIVHNKSICQKKRTLIRSISTMLFYSANLFFLCIIVMTFSHSSST